MYYRSNLIRPNFFSSCGLLCIALAGVASAVEKMTLSDLWLSNGGFDDCYETVVDVPNMPFEKAIEVTVPRSVLNPWEIQLSANVTQAVANNDVMEIVFYFRSADANPAYVCVVVEHTSNWTNSLLHCSQTAGTEWRKVVVPFQMKALADGDGYLPEEAGIRFRIGQEKQKIQIGGVELLNYGQIDFAQKQGEYTYPGIEQDAPWRAQAAQRIEMYRKGDIRIKAVDASGNPVANAPVTIVMKKHGFDFGCLATPSLITGSDANAKKYQSEFLRFFNHAVIETKWPIWVRESGRQNILNTMQWLTQRGITIRGHVLVYPAFSYNNNLLNDTAYYRANPGALRSAIYDFIADCVTACNSYVKEWDVCNELGMQVNDFVNILGWDEVPVWFTKTRQYAPHALLYLNEFGILTQSGTNIGYHKFTADNIEFIKQKGGPIGALGLQSHITADMTPPEELIRVLDKFSRHGLPIKSTELTLDIKNEALHARYLEDYMTAMFSHPSVNGIVLWGFWEGRIWNNKRGLLRADWTLRPAGETWLRLTQKEWWTDSATVMTDAQGEAVVRGFHGEYRIRIAPAIKDTVLNIEHTAATTLISFQGSALTISEEPITVAARPNRQEHIAPGLKLKVCNRQIVAAGMRDARPVIIRILSLNGRCLWEKTNPASVHGAIRIPFEENVPVKGVYVIELSAGERRERVRIVR